MKLKPTSRNYVWQTNARLDEYKPRGISHYARKMKISKNKKLRLGKNCKCWRHASINLPSEAQYFLIKIYSSLLVYNFSVWRSSCTLKKARKSNRCRSKERIQHLTPRPYNKSASRYTTLSPSWNLVENICVRTNRFYFGVFFLRADRFDKKPKADRMRFFEN